MLPVPKLPEAVCVYLEREGLVLGVSRRGTLLFGLPAGKVEPGETLLRAIVRETREETGLALDPADLRRIFRRTCGEGAKAFAAHGFDYLGDAARLRPRRREPGVEVAWHPREEFLRGAFPDYNAAFFEAIDRSRAARPRG